MILTTTVISSVFGARQSAQYAHALGELRQIEPALYFYKEDHNHQFPADVDRSLPPGLESYLNNPNDAGAWPDAPFKNSVYDWENWEPSDLTHPPYEQVQQISVRFCDINGNNCTFPDFDWTTGFDANSSMYYCIEGPCRPHASELISHPGHCVNC